MGKPYSSSSSSSAAITTSNTAATTSPVPKETTSKELPPEHVAAVKSYFLGVGTSGSVLDEYRSKDFYSEILRDLLTADLVRRGRVSCSLSVLPAVTNYYNGLHGAAVAAIAERVAIACARSVVAEDKQLFLGELGISYLSAARLHEALVVDGSVVRSGRNLSVVAIDFKIKETRKLVYTARATFYHMPASKL